MKWHARVVGQIAVPKDSFVVLDHVRARGQDYSGRKLEQFCTIGSRLEACKFNKARVDGASFGAGREMSEFVECTFDGARLDMSSGGFVRFVRCSFRSVSISNWRCFGVELIDCVFGGSMRASFFNGTMLSEDQAILGRKHNEFRGNDFSTMDLDDVSFRTGIDLTQQRLPSGPEYLYLPNAGSTLGQTRLDVMQWKNAEFRQDALGTLELYEHHVMEGQRQLLLRADNHYGSSPRQAVDDLFALLRKYSKTN